MADFGIDILIKARDQVQAGAQQAAGSLRRTLGGLATDYGEGLSSGMSRQLFRGATHGAMDAVDESLRSAAASIADWHDGKVAGAAAGTSVGYAFGASFAASMEQIPIAGGIGNILGQLLDEGAIRDHFNRITLGGLDMISDEGGMAAERKQAQHEAEAAKLLSITKAASSAAEALDKFKRSQSGMSAEELKWTQLQEQGSDLALRKYEAQRALVGDNQTAIRELISTYLAERTEIKNTIDAARGREAESERLKLQVEYRKQLLELEQRATAERIRATADLAGSDRGIADFRFAHGGASDDEIRRQALYREGTALVDARYEAEVRLYQGNLAMMAVAAAARAVELKQLHDLVDAEMQRRNDERVAEERKREGEKFAAEQKRSLERLIAAELRLAPGNESHAVLGIRFRAEAEDRARRQAGQQAAASALQPVPADPRLIDQGQKQAASLVRVESLLTKLLAAQPELVP